MNLRTSDINRQILNNVGTTTDSYDYTAWGGMVQDGSNFHNPYVYTGREVGEDDQYYYRARYYNPGVGRFGSTDPIGIRGGINAFVYADNSAMIGRDPLGLKCCCKKITIITDPNVQPYTNYPLTGVFKQIYSGGIGPNDGDPYSMGIGFEVQIDYSGNPNDCIFSQEKKGYHWNGVQEDAASYSPSYSPDTTLKPIKIPGRDAVMWYDNPGFYQYEKIKIKSGHKMYFKSKQFKIKCVGSDGKEMSKETPPFTMELTHK